MRWISAESIPRDLPDGSTVWEGVLIDITERILAQQQLKVDQERLRLLAENATDVVMQISDDGLIRWVSPSLEPMLGWRPEPPAAGPWPSPSAMLITSRRSTTATVMPPATYDAKSSGRDRVIAMAPDCG